jgi:hypothetical protein
MNQRSPLASTAEFFNTIGAKRSSSRVTVSAKSHSQTFTPAQSRAVVAATQAFAMRSRTDLKPETKRASVSDVTPRGNITSTNENLPRR